MSRREAVLGLSTQLLLLGCSASAQKAYTPPPARPSIFAGVLQRGRTSAILPVPFAVTVDQNAPMGRGEAVGRGAGAGAGAAFSSLPAGDPAAGLLIIALLPLAVIIGAIAGAAGARSREEIETAAINIKRTFDAIRPEVEIRDRIIAKLEQSGQSARGLEATEDDVEPLFYTGQSIDTVVRLEVNGFGLAVERETDPKAVVYARTRSQAVSVVTGDESAEISLFHVGNPHEYFDLAKNNASLLKMEIGSVLDGVASQIADEMIAAQA